MRLALLGSLLAACGSSPPAVMPSPPATVAPKLPERMAGFTLGAYTLTGAEYWPYAGTAEIKYPEEVLWGFYPAKGVIAPGEKDPNLADARPEAVACATRAYAALQAFLDKPDPKLMRIIELGKISGDVVPRFYLWTNDYGLAAT